MTKSIGYRIIALFDSWSSDAWLDLGRAGWEFMLYGHGGPDKQVPSHHVHMLAGGLGHQPSADEVASALAAAVREMSCCDGHSVLRFHAVLAEPAWRRLAGARLAEIEASGRHHPCPVVMEHGSLEDALAALPGMTTGHR
jgi:hypothetical protein